MFLVIFVIISKFSGKTSENNLSCLHGCQKSESFQKLILSKHFTKLFFFIGMFELIGKLYNYGYQLQK